MQTILVTGGAGFIGNCFVRQCLQDRFARIVNLDKLTYAGNLDSLASVRNDPDHVFIQADVADRTAVNRVFAEHRPSAVVHFAAESHVDRSIDGPAEFVRTNVQGTFQLLDAARQFWRGLPAAERETFRFLHVSRTRCSARWGQAAGLQKRARTIPVRPIRRRRRRPIISHASTTVPTACR